VTSDATARADPPAAGAPTKGSPPPAGRSIPDSVTRRLEALPLRVRLIAVLLVLLLLALTLTASATAALMRRDLVGGVDRQLQLAAEPVAQQAFNDLGTAISEGIPNGYAFVVLPNDGRPPIAANPVGESLHPDVPALTVRSSQVRSGEPFTIGSRDGELKWRAIAGQLGGSNAVVVVAVPLGGVDRTVRKLVLVELLIGLAVLAACAAIGWYAVQRAFRPLREIEDTASAIAAGDLARRIPTRTAKDEVTSLSRSLNVMLAQIEQSFAAREASEDRMRQFVADASHELRTPLAAVRGYAELYRQGAVREPADVASAMSRIEGEAGRMGGLVEDLLVLARLDDQRPLHFTPVDLTVLAADAAQDARAIDPERRIAVSGRGGPLGPTRLTGDEAKLRQLLANLMSNVLGHTPAGSPVEIAVGTRPSDDHVVLEVRDHGPGIDPEKAGRVFERFYRADPSRGRGAGGGSGLGLAIAAAIVAGHHGRIGVARTPDGGATFIVELPTGNSQAAPSSP
jgi:two-component system, OmpR family, sensor kinase